MSLMCCGKSRTHQTRALCQQEILVTTGVGPQVLSYQELCERGEVFGDRERMEGSKRRRIDQYQPISTLGRAGVGAGQAS